MRKALEPYMKLAPFAGIGIALVAIAIAAVLYVQRGAHVVLKGSVQKVRTLALDENSSAAVIDFRATNPSDYPFIVREVSVVLVEPDGTTHEGLVVSEVDAMRLFEYYPVLGQKFNDSLIARTKINPRETIDRMLAVRFEVPEQRLQGRQNLRIRISELDAPPSEIEEVQR
ncbi:MAG TPA: hypothetical protein PLA43_19155 [Bryobacteraceae bacterium]|nr:hypothetical protein [Bryobacteraceae bacterium]HPU74077.1 hypothetical protein [Bryobacteraceae bacterium]